MFSQTSQPRTSRARDAHVVVLEEDDPALGAAVARERDDLLHHVLALRVGRMRLAGDDDLDRQRQQPLDVGEDEAGALVGREPPREADRQPVAVDPRALGEPCLRGGVHPPDRLDGGTSRAASQFASSGGASGRTPAKRSSSASAGSSQVPRWTPFVMWPIGVSCPGQSRCPHLARDLAVQVGDAVRGGGEPQRERRQAEAGLVAGAPELEQALTLEAALGGEVADVANRRAPRRRPRCPPARACAS